MKFFYKYYKKTIFKKNQIKINKNINFLTPVDYTNISDFIFFLTKNGLFSKEKKTFVGILKNFNFFLYQNTNYLYENYPHIK